MVMVVCLLGRLPMVYAGCAGGLHTTPRPKEAPVNWMMLLIGLVVGMVSGVMGIGGGILFVPALVWLAGMSQHKAQGTSLGALLAPVGIFAFMGVLPQGQRGPEGGASAGRRVSGRRIHWSRGRATHPRPLAAAHLCVDVDRRGRADALQPLSGILFMNSGTPFRPFPSACSPRLRGAASRTLEQCSIVPLP